jgi:hypothetical protein
LRLAVLRLLLLLTLRPEPITQASVLLAVVPEQFSDRPRQAVSVACEPRFQFALLLAGESSTT